MRNYMISAAILLILCIVGPGQAVVQENADVSGEWAITIDFGTNKSEHSAVIEQDGNIISGTYKGQYLEGELEGTIEGTDIEFTARLRHESKSFRLHFMGSVEGDVITYRDDYVWDRVNVDWSDYWRGDFTAKRVKK
ncbi:hypothetical protein ES708_15574 [subsurface metagenome]